MNTTISIDKEIRDKAARRAKKERLSVSAVVRILLMDYVEGNIQIGTRVPTHVHMSEIEVDKKTQNLMDEIVNEWRHQK